MDFLLSAKGGDVTAWRAATDFTAAYRQTLLDLAAADRKGCTEALFSATCAALETARETHRNLLQRLNGLIDEVATAPAADRHRELTVAFYNDLYRHFGHFRSAPAFYQLSMTFLRRSSAAIIAQAIDRLGPDAGHLPEVTLIAVGPAGRGEYSPFCPLQILLVHGDVAASHLQTISLFSDALHAGFEAAGLAVDPVVTPRTPRWRGTVAEWQRRSEEALHPLTDTKLIDLCRLIDQCPLHPDERLSHELKRICSTLLSGNRTALANLIVRMTSLTNGLGFMGKLKLERSGMARGMFDLLNHGLLPLSAALSALALIKGSESAGTCERIGDLLKRHELDVELAERMLATWHCLHDLCLWREQALQIDEHANRVLYLDPDELTAEQRQSLKDALESVGVIQRHVEIMFSRMGE